VRSATEAMIALSGRPEQPWRMTNYRRAVLLEAAESHHPALRDLARMKLRQAAHLEALGSLPFGYERLLTAHPEVNAAQQVEEVRALLGSGVTVERTWIEVNDRPDGVPVLAVKRHRPALPASRLRSAQEDKAKRRWWWPWLA
jgi:hypothetical protein